MEGYPGKYVVIARRSGNRWFISGINGDSSERTVTLDLTALNIKSATLFTDAANGELFSKKIGIPGGVQ
ncbi:glycoside hydrolase family 97 C-terminal domain-containing protein [Niabella sp. W65]|nr:glycoside hydrolase family 97 C-terminal domain-containing protein [Niabella sp. W65]MCH7364794.1 glycoside hydrolase family 97 C-terminal domain-containing protein [Niabella sp. W65]ULT40633.1 glycoside hydrolase family 97 C-terminal domain-containing protein [Niabella sp. I65]